jgi:nicotinamidase/pyrazinamidase
MQVTKGDVLLVIDVQNDFCSGGALAVKDADTIIPVIHRIAEKFTHVILTQDWHPCDHQSFASAHPGKKAFDSIELAYGPQVLWPDHCVQGTNGAEFHPSLNLTRAELILRKGFRANIDSYSAFFENDQITSTGLAGYVKDRGLNRVFLCGLAYDFCVGYSALDARKLGIDAIIFKDACRVINTDASVSQIEEEFHESGVLLLESAQLIT